MIFYLLLCNILFIPLISCTTTVVSKLDKANNTLPGSENKPSNGTKVNLPIEGGSISPDSLLLALTKVNNTILSLESELSENKIVARKGVVYENTTSSSEKSSSTGTGPSTIKLDEKPKPSEKKELNNTANEFRVPKGTFSGNISDTLKPENKTKPVKKPLILSSDAIENEPIKPSPVTLVYNQIQSPNKEVKSYTKNANNHPGMVMPIVITILLVPMFAVLGYMALRRGQEAWKNRHYKRMDFLLDGMYND